MLFIFELMCAITVWICPCVISGQSDDLRKEIPPNILLLVADDIGWNDVGWNNPGMITPFMNKLARKGVIFDNLYVMPVCSPSRAAIMTGYYPYHLGLQNNVINQNFPKYVPKNVTMLSEKLRTLGYRTHMVGKWHLGNCNLRYTPTRRGFDDFLGLYSSGLNHYTRIKEAGTDAVGAYDFRYNLSIYRPPEEYLSEMYAKHSEEVISKHNREYPLFIYVAFNEPHLPLQAPEEYSALYGCVKDTNRRIYSGMITAIDVAVKRIVGALKKYNLMKNTLIFFLSDNGGDTTTSSGNNLPFRGEKQGYYEGGTKSASFIYSIDLLEKKRYRNSRLMHVVDIFPTLISLAGGSADHDIDGKNQWPAMSKDAESARNEFVYNINEQTGEGIIRVGDLKLIRGLQEFPSWYQLQEDVCDHRPSGNFRNRIYHKKKTNVKKKSNLQFEVDSCKESGIESIYSLFNITGDPEERVNIACSHPDKLDFMIKRLEHYEKSLVPDQEQTNDPGIRSSVIHGIVSHSWCT